MEKIDERPRERRPKQLVRVYKFGAMLVEKPFTTRPRTGGDGSVKLMVTT